MMNGESGGGRARGRIGRQKRRADLYLSRACLSWGYVTKKAGTKFFCPSFYKSTKLDTSLAEVFDVRVCWVRS